MTEDKARGRHEEHLDERIRLRALQRQEEHARERALERAIAAVGVGMQEEQPDGVLDQSRTAHPAPPTWDVFCPGGMV